MAARVFLVHQNEISKYTKLTAIRVPRDPVSKMLQRKVRTGTPALASILGVYPAAPEDSTNPNTQILKDSEAVKALTEVSKLPVVVWPSTS